MYSTPSRRLPSPSGCWPGCTDAVGGAGLAVRRPVVIPAMAATGSSVHAASEAGDCAGVAGAGVDGTAAGVDGAAAAAGEAVEAVGSGVRMGRGEAVSEG